MPLDSVDFAIVEEFCRNWPEGVRVDYKEKPANIPKVVSSFANTSGGIWIIGVTTDEFNKPIFPLSGLLASPGLEEQISQSSCQGIYPPIIPLVRVIPFPTDTSKYYSS
jgi:predicted HTH transcriptional regulator